MSLLSKIFGGGQAQDTQFEESDGLDEDAASDGAPRRDLVHIALRDVMRQHAVPRDWLDCRILSVVNRKDKPAIHVQLIVLKGEEQLLPYVHALQDSLWQDIERYDPRARDWLLSIAWQFEGRSPRDPSQIPRFEGWDDDEPAEPHRMPAGVQDTQPMSDDEMLLADLAQLKAIREADKGKG